MNWIIFILGYVNVSKVNNGHLIKIFYAIITNFGLLKC